MGGFTVSCSTCGWHDAANVYTAAVALTYEHAEECAEAATEIWPVAS